MTDRELLEAAAKAAGIEGSYQKYIDSDRNCGIVVYGDITVSYWNPLTDDGDALRLLTNLNLQIQIVPGWAVAYVGSVASKQFSERRHDGDPYAATRRAIVRAAAEIGANS